MFIRYSSSPTEVFYFGPDVLPDVNSPVSAKDVYPSQKREGGIRYPVRVHYGSDKEIPSASSTDIEQRRSPTRRSYPNEGESVASLGLEIVRITTEGGYNPNQDEIMRKFHGWYDR